MSADDKKHEKLHSMQIVKIFSVVLKRNIFMPPSLKKVEGVYCFGLARVCVCSKK